LSTKSPENNFIRRRGYLAPIGTDVRKIAKPVLGKKGFFEIDIIANWHELAGEKIAAFATPLKLTFPKGKNAEAVLHISVAGGAFATELSHKKPSLLEKINTFFGYSAVGDIKIIQDSFSPKKERKKDSSSQAPKSKKDVSLELQNIISEVGDDDLQSALKRLAETF